MKTLKTATKEDFKVGNTIIEKSGTEFRIYEHYDGPQFEATNGRGCKVVDAGEAEHFFVIRDENLNVKPGLNGFYKGIVNFPIKVVKKTPKTIKVEFSDGKTKYSDPDKLMIIR